MQTTAMDRRAFVSTAALGAGIAACAGIAAAPAAHASEAAAPAGAFEDTVAWDAEYDVVVVGLGGAGCATAITAADEGARVLVVEKAPLGESGGNSNVCMQFMGWTADPDMMVQYMKDMRGGYVSPSDEFIETYVEEMTHNKEFIESLGASDTTSFVYQEFPEFESSACFAPFTTNGYNGIVPETNFGGDGMTYRLLKQNVVDRADAIDVWYEAPATALIQDPATKIVHGVTCEVEGAPRNIRALNGVVLCCGGYENNKEMQNDYNGCTFWPSLGRALYNEGDGIKMALEVNADLWHMANRATTNGEFYDETTQTLTFVFLKYAASLGIVLGADGSRIDESHVLFPLGNRHGKVWNHGQFTQPVLPDTMWYVFDANILAAGQVHSAWSPDLSDEIAAGWVRVADTLDELAQVIGIEGDAAQRMMTTIDNYNGFCETGNDVQYGRTKFLEPIAQGPFYAVPITVATVNTQGGPRRNERGEILDTHGDPIPHLYEAGELGDVWSNLYQAGNNLGGGMIFGRISGRNASAEKGDNFRGSVMEGKEAFAPTAAPIEYECAENQYIGRGLGKSPAPIVVRMTVEAGAIADVEVLEQYETDGLLPVARALRDMPAAMVEANDVAVDIVAGATRTSAGILAAVYDAFSQVK